jgi:hypothetical protein
VRDYPLSSRRNEISLTLLGNLVQGPIEAAFSVHVLSVTSFLDYMDGPYRLVAGHHFAFGRVERGEAHHLCYKSAFVVQLTVWFVIVIIVVAVIVVVIGIAVLWRQWDVVRQRNRLRIR